MFNAHRLTLARQRRGVTKAKLAAVAGVAPRGISAYESGETVPLPETLAKIAAELRFPLSFFEGDDLDVPDEAGVSFRAMTRMTASQRDAALGAAALAMALTSYLDAKFHLPVADVPDLRGETPEHAAEALRAAWGLGVHAIRNVVHLLEQHGVRVYSLVEERAELDAFSFWRGDTPYVFLNTKKSAERSRFDAAHELGHVVLHRHGAPQGRKPELEADAFASAFLMPRSAVLAHGHRASSLDQVIIDKRRWHVSVGALAHRLRDVGLISDWHYRALCIEISERGFRKREPNGIARETSQVLAKVFHTLREEGVTKADVARDLRITPTELDTLVFGLVFLNLPGGDRGRSRPRASLKLVR